MEDFLKELSIKGEPKVLLLNCLVSLTKDKMISIAEHHNININEKLSKEKMAEIVSEKLITDFSKDLEYLQMDELTFISEILKEPFSVNDEVKYNQINTLKDFGYMYLFYFEGHFYPILPRELISIINITFVGNFEERFKHNQSLFCYACALVNLYGVCYIEQFVNVWNNHNKDKITLENVKEYLEKMCCRQNYFWTEDEILYNEVFGFEEDYIEILDQSDFREYYMPTKSDILYFSTHEYDERSEYYKKMENYITAKELTERIKEDAMYIIANGAVVDSEFKEVLFELTEMDICFEGLPDIEIFMELFVNLSNDTRKWILCGNKPSQLSIESSNPFTNSFTTQKNNQRVAIQRVGRNEPCPCGSGKKYKKCCGQ